MTTVISERIPSRHLFPIYVDEGVALSGKYFDLLSRYPCPSGEEEPIRDLLFQFVLDNLCEFHCDPFGNVLI